MHIGATHKKELDDGIATFLDADVQNGVVLIVHPRLDVGDIFNQRLDRVKISLRHSLQQGRLLRIGSWGGAGADAGASAGAGAGASAGAGLHLLFLNKNIQLDSRCPVSLQGLNLR